VEAETRLLLEMARGGAAASLIEAEGFTPPDVATARHSIAQEAVASIVATALDRSIGPAAGEQTSQTLATRHRGAKRKAGGTPSQLVRTPGCVERQPGTADAPKANEARHSGTTGGRLTV
jgi:hypothetical protein